MCLSCARQTESQCVMKRKCEAEGTAMTSQWVWKWGEQIGGNKGLYLLKNSSIASPNLILFVPTIDAPYTCCHTQQLNTRTQLSTWLGGGFQSSLISICGSAESNSCFRRAAMMRKKCFHVPQVVSYNNDPSLHLFFGRYS